MRHIPGNCHLSPNCHLNLGNVVQALEFPRFSLDVGRLGGHAVGQGRELRLHVELQGFITEPSSTTTQR